MKIAFEIDLSFWQDPNFVPLLAKIGVGVVIAYLFIIFLLHTVDRYHRQVQKERLEALKEQRK